DLNAKNWDSSTPLHSACYAGHINIVELLLKKGADPHVRTKWGKTPLDIAHREGQHVIVAML
ncbi:ankyrin, partial [Paxillus ammoniavirescens]